MIAVDLLAPIALTQARVAEDGAGRRRPDRRDVERGGDRRRAAALGVQRREARADRLSRRVRAENEHLGIQVHVFAPGSVRTNVSRNALVADGSTRGVSDAAIEAGISPAESAEAMLAAIEAGTRELVLATGLEHDIVMLRRRDPEALFDQMSMLVRAGYAQSMAADTGKS